MFNISLFLTYLLWIQRGQHWPSDGPRWSQPEALIISSSLPLSLFLAETEKVVAALNPFWMELDTDITVNILDSIAVSVFVVI